MKYYEIYTDGATRPSNPGPSGYAAILYENEEVREAVSGYLGDGVTNNQAEYAAVLAGIDMFSTLEIETPCELVICADSQLIINQLEGRFALRAASLGPFHAAIKGKLSLMLSAGVSVSFKHVKGHSGIPGNELADEMAGAAVQYKIECNPLVLRYLSQSQGKNDVTEKGHEKLAAQVTQRFHGQVLDTSLHFSPAERARLYRQGSITDKFLLHFPSLVLMAPNATTLLVLATGFKRQGEGPALRTMDADAFKVAQNLALSGESVMVVHRPHAGGKWLIPRELNWLDNMSPIMAVYANVLDLEVTQVFDQEGWPTFVAIEMKDDKNWTAL